MNLSKITLVLLISMAIHDSIADDRLNHEQFAIIYVKHSGLFDRHIDKNFSIADCVTFLQANGIELDWLDVITKKNFTRFDMARVVGQSYLLFAGKENRNDGSYILPDGYEGWDEYCDLHGLNYQLTYEVLCKTINNLKNF